MMSNYGDLFLVEVNARDVWEMIAVAFMFYWELTYSLCGISEIMMQYVRAFYRCGAAEFTS